MISRGAYPLFHDCYSSKTRWNTSQQNALAACYVLLSKYLKPCLHKANELWCEHSGFALQTVVDLLDQQGI